jgi:hypothetical protein
LSEPFTEWMEDYARDGYQAMHNNAGKVFAEYCGDNVPLDQEFCDVLKRLIAIPEPTAKDAQNPTDVVSSTSYAQAYNRAIDKLDEKKPTEWIDPIAGGLVLGLREYNIAAGALRYEMSSISPLPHWTFWMRAFAPHLFAFVLGIKVMRSIAAFGL